MKHKNVLLLLMCLIASAINAEPITVNLSAPGQLRAKLKGYDIQLVQALVIKGNRLNHDDMTLLREMTCAEGTNMNHWGRLQQLDISEVQALDAFHNGNISDGTFRKSILKSIILPYTCSEIGAEAFLGSELEIIALQNTKTIGLRAFSQAKLTAVFTDKSIRIESEAFKGCEKLEMVKLGGLEASGKNVFWDCKELASIYISGNVDELPTDFIMNCPKLEFITVVGQVNVVGSRFVSACDALQCIVFKGNVMQINAHALAQFPKLEAIMFLADVSNIGDYFVKDCPSLLSLYIKGEVALIGSHFVSACDALESIKINGTVSFIGSRFLSQSRGKTAINFGGEVHAISEYFVSDCPDIEQVVFQGKVSASQQYLFLNCGVRTVAFKSNVNTLGSHQFVNCPRLEAIYLLEGVQKIGANFAQNCPQLKYFELRNQVQTIGEFLFQECGLEDIKIEAEINHLSSKVAYLCPQLKRMIFKNNVHRAESELVVSCPELEEIVFSKDVLLDTKSELVKNCPKLRQVSCYQNMETILVE